MKLLGYTTKVVKYLVSTAENYIPSISANSIEEYAEKYSQEAQNVNSVDSAQKDKRVEFLKKNGF